MNGNMLFAYVEQGQSFFIVGGPGQNLLGGHGLQLEFVGLVTLPTSPGLQEQSK